LRISAIDTVDARELIGEKGVLHIMLDGETYILRLTRKDRLILTK
jgi:hemin uptake protein HemP